MGVTPWPESTPPYYLVAFFFPATVRFGPLRVAGVGLGALTARREVLTVTLALVAVDLDLATDVRVDFTTQIALDLVIAFEVITQRNQLLIRQILTRISGLIPVAASVSLARVRPTPKI